MPRTKGAPWWREAVFYQIYPRSFSDSDGDGIGDLPGLIGKLDYLRELGVDALWLSPFFPSPQADFGYDVADYRGVDPAYGRPEDAARLFAEAKARGLRIILDLVVNHCSIEHPWFKAARASKGAREHDWFIWKPIQGGRPNNWQSLFELRSAWYPNPATEEYYLATFTRHQPEFDWRNPELRAEIYAVMRHWLELGADGFRLDVATAYLKDESFRSNPFRLNAYPDFFQLHLYDRNRPEVLEIFREMRAIVDEYGAVLVGETHGQDAELAAYSYGPADDGLSLAFNFDFMNQPWKAERLEASATAWYEALGEKSWPTFTLSNHDKPRHAFRYCPEGFSRGLRREPDPALAERADRRAKAAALLLLGLRGTPFLYYGEELGKGCYALPRSALRDPLGIKTWPLRFIGRDPERSPMTWSPAQDGGFGAAAPWLPLDPDWRRRNVETESADPDSVLSFYKRLLALRRAEPSLRSGSLSFLALGPGLLGFLREGEGRRLAVLLNTGRKPRRAELPFAARILLSTRRDDRREGLRPEGGRGGENFFLLAPDEGLVLEVLS